ncbi:WD repeat-containing protein 87 [Allomyces javanicus]|nr:WD repeat-containing protein 87 [Allomyces javanicus]
MPGPSTPSTDAASRRKSLQYVPLPVLTTSSRPESRITAAPPTPTAGNASSRPSTRRKSGNAAPTAGMPVDIYDLVMHHGGEPPGGALVGSAVSLDESEPGDSPINGDKDGSEQLQGDPGGGENSDDPAGTGLDPIAAAASDAKRAATPTTSKPTTANASVASGIVLPLTIPYGFQLQRSLLHGKATVRAVLFTPHGPAAQAAVPGAAGAAMAAKPHVAANPNADAFVSMDAHHVHQWRGQMRVKKRELGGMPSTQMSSSANSTSPRAKTPGPDGVVQAAVIIDEKAPIAQGGLGLGALIDPIAKWVYLKRHRLVIVASDRLELKVLDHNLTELWRCNCAKPVLTMEACDELDEIVIGIYTLRGPRLTITDLTEDDWVSKTMHRASQNRLYVACDGNIYVYDYDSGKRIDMMLQIHDITITALAVHEPSDFLVTGAKDGTIKVWNSQHALVSSFRDHHGAISALLFPLAHTAQPRPPPILVSGSLDGSLRMWDLDKGRCVYRQPTGHNEVLGMGMMRRDTFYHYSRRAIGVWHLNRLTSTFCTTQSQVTHLYRVVAHSATGRKGPRARIVLAAEDGSIRLVSPVSGTVLLTCFPSFKQTHIVEVVHDLPGECIYSLMSNGEIVVYDTRINPSKVLRVLDPSISIESSRVTCMTALANPWQLVGGTDSGQIVSINPDTGHRDVLVQGHPADIVALQRHPSQGLLLSTGNDKTVKAWRIHRRGTFPPTLDLVCVHPLAAFPCRLRPAATSATADTDPHWMLATNANHALVVHETPMHGGAPTHAPPTSGVLPHDGSGSVHSSLAGDTGLGGGSSAVPTLPTGPGRAWTHSPDEEHTKLVTCIDHLPTLRLYVTAGMDGVVKLWSAQNVLVREIQVGEPVTAVAFANARGDLLLGVHDEVSVVRWKDYLPLDQCKAIQDINPPDDPLEEPMAFDPGLDFWDGFQAKPEFDRDQWTMCLYSARPQDHAELQDSELMREFETELRGGRPVTSKMAMSHRLSVAVDPTSSLTATSSASAAESHTSLDNLALGRLIKTTQRVKKLAAFPDDHFGNHDASLDDMLRDLNGSFAVGSGGDTGLWSTLDGYMREGAMHASQRYAIQPNKLYRPQITDEERQSVEDRGAAIEEYKNKHKITTIDEKMRKIRRKLEMIGALRHGVLSLPNSTVAAKVEHSGDEAAMAQVVRMAVKKRDVKDLKARARRNGKKPPPKPASPPSDLDMAESLGNLEELDEEEEHVPTPPKPVSPPPPPPPVKVPDPPKAPTPPPPQPPRDPTPPPPPPPEPAPEPEPEPPRDPTPPPVRTSLPVIVSDSPPKPEPKSPVKMVTPKPPPIKKPAPPPAPPPLALGALGRKKPAKKDPPPKPVRAPKPVPPPVPAKPKSPPPKSATPVPPSVPVTPHTPRHEDQVVWSMLRRRPTVAAHAAVKPTEYHLDMRRRASTETATSGESPGDELQHKLHRVMSLSWFPGLGGRGVTVDNVVSVLGECVRSGANARARVEATKMLAYVHTVFQRDIREPATMLLAPQLEALANDPDWHVRAQIAAALPRFGYYHQDVVMGLVARLGDVHPAVRQAAMQSLAFYHIESREQLETVMIRLGLLSAPSGTGGRGGATGGKGAEGGKYRSILDDLYDQYVRREQQKVTKSVATVQQWLTSAQYRYTKRLSSVGGGVVEGGVGGYDGGVESRL